jgi:hypothetical protein
MFRSGKKHIVPLVVHGLPLTGSDTGQLQALKKDKDQLQKELDAMKEQYRSLENSVATVSTSWSLKCRRVPVCATMLHVLVVERLSVLSPCDTR